MGIRDFIRQKAKEATGYGLAPQEKADLRKRRSEEMAYKLAKAKEQRALLSERFGSERERLAIERERIGVQRLRQQAQPRGQPPGFFGQGYSQSGGMRPFDPLTGRFLDEGRPASAPRKKAKSRRRRRR
jgi:hypothetical protein